MKTTYRAALLAAAVAITGCASTGTTTTPATSTPAPAPAVPAANLPELPTLKVSLDCGPCQVDPAIPGQIVDGYNAAAAKAGRKVTSAKEAQLVIKDYSARNNAARFLVGAMAGKDEIKAVVTYQGKTYNVEDYYRNAWMGISTLAAKIGDMTYGELK